MADSADVDLDLVDLNAAARDIVASRPALISDRVQRTAAGAAELAESLTYMLGAGFRLDEHTRPFETSARCSFEVVAVMWEVRNSLLAERHKGLAFLATRSRTVGRPPWPTFGGWVALHDPRINVPAGRWTLRPTDAPHPFRAGRRTLQVPVACAEQLVEFADDLVALARDAVAHERAQPVRLDEQLAALSDARQLVAREGLRAWGQVVAPGEHEPL